MLDFRMKTFLTVCESMNFTHAAESLHLTQPAVSQHIKYLEEIYGAPLFLREKRGLKLTPAGEILRQALETMRNDEEHIKKRIKNSLVNQKSLTFGVTMTIGEYAVIPALAEFIKSHPETNFHIRYGNTQTLLSELREGIIDFAIVEGYSTSEHYETRNYQTEEYIAVCAARHQFQKPIRMLKDLTGERLLIREQGSGTRAILTKTLALKNMSIHDFQRIVELENIHAIVSLLCRDCGISFLYKAAVTEELKSGRLVQIPLVDFMVMHDFTFLWNKGSLFSDEYEHIFQELQKGGPF